MTRKHRKKDGSIIREPVALDRCSGAEVTDEQSAVAESSTTSAPLVDCEEAIRSLAYHKWIEAGCPDGDGVDHWLEAERQVLAGKPEA